MVVTKSFKGGFFLNNSADYIKAARILSKCPVSRLPQVVELLRRGGIDVDDDFVSKCVSGNRMEVEKNLKRKRALISCSHLDDGGDEFLRKLYSAYSAGLSLTKIGEEVGITKTSMYRYLHGNSYPRAKDKERLIAVMDRYLSRTID